MSFEVAPGELVHEPPVDKLAPAYCVSFDIRYGEIAANTGTTFDVDLPLLYASQVGSGMADDQINKTPVIFSLDNHRNTDGYTIEQIRANGSRSCEIRFFNSAHDTTVPASRAAHEASHAAEHLHGKNLPNISPRQQLKRKMVAVAGGLLLGAGVYGLTHNHDVKTMPLAVEALDTVATAVATDVGISLLLLLEYNARPQEIRARAAEKNAPVGNIITAQAPYSSEPSTTPSRRIIQQQRLKQQAVALREAASMVLIPDFNS